jgi:hypothetical protein
MGEIAFGSTPHEEILLRYRSHRVMRILLMFLLILGEPVWISGWLVGQSRVTVTAQTSSPGVPIPSDFLGLSFETADILPMKSGDYRFFRPNNVALITLFQTLGVKSLRIGGSSADAADTKIPTDSDIDELFHFANAGHVKVIYTLRLLNSSPDAAAAAAKYLMAHYAADIECIAIGNEPNVLKPYDKVYLRYRNDLRTYMQALIAVDPNIKFCGPNTSPGNGPAWAAAYAKDFADDGHIRWVTQHSYPGGNGLKVTDPAAARLQMLSSSFSDRDERLYQSFVPEVEAGGLKYRLEETNSFWGGGAEDVSNTYASALWGLGYLYWWAQHGAQGINFHTGEEFVDESDASGAHHQTRRFWYAVFRTSGDGYTVQPLAYALKAFDLCSAGTIIPVTISPTKQNLSVYGVLGRDRSLYLTLINKEVDGRKTEVRIETPPGYGKAELMTLSAQGTDLAATAGITLGGSSIDANGRWRGEWRALESNGKPGEMAVALEPASAVIIRLASSRKRR